jgi:hypothetical protein
MLSERGWVQGEKPITYSERQGQRDREYQSEHAKWLGSLTAAQLAEVKKMGLDTDPLSEPPSHSAFSRDAADLPVAAKTPQPELSEDPRWEVIRHIVSYLLESKDTRLEVEVLAMVSGVCWAGGDPIGIARRHGLHRAAISARAIKICEQFGLPPSRVMRSIAARLIAKKARKRSLMKQ